MKSIPLLLYVIRGFRTINQRVKALSKTAMVQASSRLKRSGSEVETLFLEFGMKEQYLLAKRNRFLDDQAQPNQIQATRLLKDLSIH